MWTATASSSALEEQRERSRSGDEAGTSRVRRRWPRSTTASPAAPATSEFLGYETTTAPARVRAIIRDGMEYEELEARPEVELRVETAVAAELVLDETPFYAEGGGQIGDRGVIRDSVSGDVLFTVDDTQRPVAGLIVHRGRLHGRVAVGRQVVAEVDAERRARTMRNHTGHPRAPSGPPQHGRRAGAPGGLARDARLPALRLPRRPPAEHGRAARDRGRGASRHPRGPARHRPAHDDGRGHRGRRRRLLRREVRRASADRSRSRATATSSAAARIAARPARSAASSSRASGPSARACGASRR